MQIDLASQKSPLTLPRNFTLSVAPMLDWTDRHCRYFHRQLSQTAVLYTEMVTTGALLFGKGDFLAFHPSEQPVVLQLGGSDPDALAKSAVMAQQRGYRAVNLNVGCPSDRVQNGSFGACLMAEPDLVGRCVMAMQRDTDLQVTVKTRLGIDELDSDAFLDRFIDTVAAAGCKTFILHARKAWLKGLSPKQNREVPPLQYERVYRAKARSPELNIQLNGGVKTLFDLNAHSALVDGVMIGREAYQNPWILTEFDQVLGRHEPVPERLAVIQSMVPYINAHAASERGRVWHVVRHMLGLFQGLPGAKRWRQYLSQNGPQAECAETLLMSAYHAVMKTAEETNEKMVDYANSTG